MFKFFEKRFFILFMFPFFLGSLTVLSFEPFNIFFINFFILPILFYLIIYVKKKSKSTYRKKPFFKNLFFLGTSFGFSFFLFGFYWIFYSLTFDESFKFLIPIGVILIPLFLSLFFSIPIMAIGNLCEKNISSIFLITLAFTISDFLRSSILTGFPWNIWAYSFSWSLESLQILSTIGLFSFNIFIIFFFFVPSILFFKAKGKFLTLGMILIILFSNYLYGSYKINSIEKNDNEKKVNFKIVSGSMNLSSFKNEKEVISKLIRYSKPEKDKETIFVWPEGVITSESFLNSEYIKNAFKKNFSDKHLIILGANTVQKKSSELNYYNSMLFVNKDFEVISQYDKKKLVPFGEFLPMENILTRIGLNAISSSHSSFSKGKRNSITKLNFSSNNISLLTLVCYEIIFPSFINQNNSTFNFIVNISEDAWFGDSIGPYQHFKKAIFRSIENNIYTIRSTNRGISAFIDPNGRILKSLMPSEVGNIEIELPVQKNSKDKPKKSLIFLLLLITFLLTFLILRKLKI